ncbi:MAG: EAL domain-containing protein [Christensenellales bacterium]
MKYDLVLSIIYYLCGCFYMVFGAYMITINVKSHVNRLYVITTSSMAIWALSFSISISAPTAEVSAFLASFSALGWGVFYSLFFHFILILTKTIIRLNKRVMHALIYIPALINVFLFGPYGYHAEEQYKMVWTDFGWANKVPIDIWEIWFIAYYAVFVIASLTLLIRWWIKIEPQTRLKRQATYFLISILFPLFLGIATETVPVLLGIEFFPKLTIVFLMVPITTLFFASRKFGLLLERKKEIPIIQESNQSANETRLRLFETMAAIFTLGGALSFLIGYYGMKRALEYELLLAASFLVTGVLIRLVPSIIKKKTIQNTLFLILAILGMLYLMIKKAQTGGITVWAIYILFLLFTIVLDSKIHAYIFVAVSIIAQIFFWIYDPKVSVIIDGNEYATRIFIIVLSSVAVRYLTDEYASKLKGYQRFSKEQETLERISTSFISINNENAKDKIDEMFKMANEILKFDQAFFVELDKDYKDATILNMYVEDNEIESFSYNPGMKFNLTASPVFMSLMEQKTIIMCEDTTNITFEVAEKHKDYFILRGIKSFFAMPITIDNEVRGVFVIEYKRRIDINLTENRLSFLKIIANIMGDARKKTLYEEMLYNFAYFDESTKLANRNMLKKSLEEMISHREETEKLVIFDVELDNLRMINDTFGHSIGERIVTKSASILKNLMKEGCDLSRVGEGKFIVVMPVAETAEQIEECANKIVDAFSNPILPSEGIEALFVIVNVGISVYPDDGKDVETLLKNADLAAYEARSSDNKIVFCSEQLKNRTEENTLLTNRLFHALQNEEFSLEFQPQISCSTERTVGIEALLRWNYDDKKRIPPDRFIPILEQTGLIYDVGLWVLEQALQEHNRLIAKGFPSLRVSVNLSVVQFQGENFIPDFRKIIEESGVNPKYIELEITESLFSKNPEDVINKLYKLKELGVRITIDDFGKGYSSLNRLKLVPFDRIKIDKEIIDYIDLKNKKAPITNTIILLAKAFSADITAEGVETKEQADFLRSIYCGEIQGYYYSRPLSPEALEEFLKKESLTAPPIQESL